MTLACLVFLTLQAPMDRALALGLERSRFGTTPGRAYLKQQWEQMGTVLLFPAGRSDVRYEVFEVIASPDYKPFLSKERKRGDSIQVEWTIPLVHAALKRGDVPVNHSAWGSRQEHRGTLGAFLVRSYLAPKSRPRGRPSADLKAPGGLATYRLAGLDEDGLVYSFALPVADDESEMRDFDGHPGWPRTEFPYPITKRERRLLHVK